MKAKASTAEAPEANVVHLVHSFSDPLHPPATIDFGRRVTASASVVIWILLAAGAVGTAFLLGVLWTSDSPGWWFNVIFTAMPTLFLLGCSIALLESRRLARLEQRISERWTATGSGARPTTAHIVDRDVQLTEHGSVSSFTITGETADGVRIMARWYRSSPTNADKALLQPQVPAVGSMIQIWAVPGASDGDPHVVEAIDPSVVSDRDE